MVDTGGKHVKVWTVAPEREDLLPFLSYAKQVNPDVVFAIGHSEATPMQVRSNMGRYRPSVLTHAMNATGRLPVFGGTRGYGIDEYCFCERDMYAELISDSCGIHVHPEMQKLLLHTKGVDKVILITDSTVHHNPAPENLKHVPDLNFDPNGGIAGSRLTMNLACRNIMKHTNCGIAQAFIMASLNPARLLGMDAEIGSIEVGKIADLVLVDDRFNVKSVLLGGIPQDLNA
jgi:N-acetylglucosamine-6-phosphate deacetylase